MAKTLNKADKLLRKLVEEYGGELAIISVILGVSPSALSHRMHTEKHGAWWRLFKARRSRERRRERGRRYRARLAQGRWW